MLTRSDVAVVYLRCAVLGHVTVIINLGVDSAHLQFCKEGHVENVDYILIESIAYFVIKHRCNDADTRTKNLYKKLACLS